MEAIIKELRQAVNDYDPEAAELAAHKVINHGYDPVLAITKGLRTYRLPRSRVCSPTGYQVVALSCERNHPRQRGVTPGSPAGLPPRKPPIGSCSTTYLYRCGDVGIHKSRDR